MKNSIMFMAITMMIGSAQAISFTWNLAPSGLEDLSNVNVSDGTPLYLVWDSAGDGFDGYNTSGVVNGDDVWMSSTTSISGGHIANITVNFTDGQSYTTGNGGTAVLNANQANVRMLIVGVATFGSVLYYNDSTVLSRQMTPSSGSPVTGYGFADASMSGGLANVPTDPGWTPIPEPTSLALLAVGAIAIGLRRKFRM